MASDIDWTTIKKGDLLILDGGRLILLEYLGPGDNESLFKGKVIDTNDTRKWSNGYISNKWSKDSFKYKNGIFKDINNQLDKLEQTYGNSKRI